MINFNGSIQEDTNFSLTNNSAFLYGDALFDTLVVKNNTIVFSEAHYFRLVASMRQLRMEIPSFFTQSFWEKEIQKLLKANSLINARVRTSIYRNNEGLRTVKSNEICFLIHTNPLSYKLNTNYTLGIYKDNYLNISRISSIKTTNRIPNILAGIYAHENKYDNCLLLNNKKQVADATNANIFLVKDNLIKTPALSEACIDGIIRKKIIEILHHSNKYKVLETTIEAFELLKADEIFLTNSVIGIQPVTKYKKRNFKTDVSKDLLKKLEAIVY